MTCSSNPPKSGLFKLKSIFCSGSKKDAENAASARALDCYRFRFINNNSTPVLNTAKYCGEDPYECNTHDIIHQLTGVVEEIHGEMSRHVPWKLVPVHERIAIRY